MKTRVNYKIGDRVFLKKDAPKFMQDVVKQARYGNHSLILAQKDYNGYTVHLKDPQGKVVQHFSSVHTKHFTKLATRSLLLQYIESKQTEIRTINEEIESYKDQIQLMDELGVAEIDEVTLEYARKFAKNMKVDLKDAYNAIKDGN